jgi:hypothetical protein
VVIAGYLWLSDWLSDWLSLVISGYQRLSLVTALVTNQATLVTTLLFALFLRLRGDLKLNVGMPTLGTDCLANGWIPDNTIRG